MLGFLKELMGSLTPTYRRRFFALQILVVTRALAETAAVASIGPFTLLVSRPGVLEGQGKIAALFRWSGLAAQEFTALAALFVLLAMVIAALLSISTTFVASNYSQNVGADISSRLFAHYLGQPWLYHTQHNSALLTKRITVEAARITRGVITPLLQMISSVVLATTLAIAMFALAPAITLVGISIFSFAYLITYGTVRRRIFLNGKRISEQSARQYKLISESFGGIREILLRDSQAVYSEMFRRSSKGLAKAQARNAALATAPRYIIELAALSSMVFAVLYLIRRNHGDVSVIIPILSMYGLAAFKLLPAFQNIYASVATIKGAQVALASLKDDLKAATSSTSGTPGNSPTSLPILSAIELRDVTFTYPGSKLPALQSVDMTFGANRIIGLAGASGAGKSTLIDIVLALVEADSGSLIVDGVPIDHATQPLWRNSIGFVPQAIYLADASIRENVAFGIPPGCIDDQRVIDALRKSSLYDLIDDLPEKLATRVGERGVQLSGGQRQRIGIARALYRDPSLLILDEATNALDAATEDRILKAIVGASKERTTLIIAHHVKTLQLCDEIYLVENGQVITNGTYNELVENSQEFRDLHLLP